MKVEDIAEAIAKLPPDQLARFRHWFAAFEAGRTDQHRGVARSTALPWAAGFVTAHGGRGLPAG
jgi:hypothetical protein